MYSTKLPLEPSALVYSLKLFSLYNLDVGTGFPKVRSVLNVDVKTD